MLNNVMQINLFARPLWLSLTFGKQQFPATLMAETSYIRWYDIDFVLDQYAKLDFYGASSLKSNSTVHMLLH
jgi:hypothetical protein